MLGEQEAQHRMQHDIRLNWAIRKKKSREILCIHIENKTTAISGQWDIKQCNVIDIDLGKKEMYKRSKKYK